MKIIQKLEDTERSTKYVTLPQPKQLSHYVSVVDYHHWLNDLHDKHIRDVVKLLIKGDILCKEQIEYIWKF